ncbi:unnamed protein product [Macrosiphum euphorbiae]|uniref:HAT C-terminal dimerisation domain-containing protein n=1 Tax=Macrosiphum euphorbiae TaxID=13131 RepID=A0AAV0YB27_9HEMI|nr:unnamed protein product [Macrosiphum euphorbiae]
MARTLLEKWSQFDTLFASIIILDLFSITSPVSKYLQSDSIDYLRAWRSVETLLELVSKKRNGEHYTKLYNKCKLFAQKLNTFFIDEPLLDFQDNFVSKRISVKKKNPGELSNDEVKTLSPFKKTRGTYFQILDTVKMSINERFVPNKELLMDIAWLDPSKYKEIVNLSLEQLPSNSLNKLSKLAGVDRKTLFVELKQFAEQYSSFSATTRSVNCEHNVRETIDTEDDVAAIKQPKCGDCLPKVYQILYEITSKSDLFNTLYLTMKYVLVLPCTQVSCERAFSKLKILKTKLRSSIRQEHLEPLMSLFVEEDLIQFIQKDEIIDQLASSSQELKRLLF